MSDDEISNSDSSGPEDQLLKSILESFGNSSQASKIEETCSYVKSLIQRIRNEHSELSKLKLTKLLLTAAKSLNNQVKNLKSERSGDLELSPDQWMNLLEDSPPELDQEAKFSADLACFKEMIKLQTFEFPQDQLAAGAAEFQSGLSKANQKSQEAKVNSLIDSISNSNQKLLTHFQATPNSKLRLDPVTEEFLSSEFLSAFYLKAVSQDPHNVECLLQLSKLFHRQGLYEKSLEMEIKLVDLRPHTAIFHYKLACSYSLLNEIELGLSSLRKALELGFVDKARLTLEESLENLRDSIGLDELLLEFFS